MRFPVMKTFIKILKVVGNVLIWLFVVFAILVTVLVFSAQGNRDGLSSIMGKSLVNIVSDSMAPTFKKGDLIIDNVLTDEQKLNCKVGEVITFYADLDKDGEDEINTHRIAEVYSEGGYTYYITKGDNTTTNPVNDEIHVISAKVLGKYTEHKIPGAGTVISFLQTSTGFLCVIVIPLVLFFLFEFYNFISVLVKVKSKGKKLTPEEEEEIKRRAVDEYLRQMHSEAFPEVKPATESTAAAPASAEETAPETENSDENPDK